MKTYTLITGASKGIGKAFAFECAAKKMNLILVARSAELLSQLAKDLREKNIDVRTFALDLLQDDAVDKLFSWIKEERLSVNMLINNAGIGAHGAFADQTLIAQLNVMKLNMDVMVKMAHTFIHQTDGVHRRYMLNTASTGAFQPVPNMGIYVATKAFILSFTESLHYEMKNKNMHVTALCPGGTETEFFNDSPGLVKVVEKTKNVMMKADIVARKGLNGLLRNKAIVIPGFVNKVGAVTVQLMPRGLVTAASAKIFAV